MLSNVQIITKDDGQRVAIAFGYAADPLLADESHPNFKRIVEQWLSGDAERFADLFDIPQAITAAFSRLSERVVVKDGGVYFDGDQVHGHVIDAILAFMDAGEDVGPLVNFYEKLTTNPLGNVQDGVYSWITGQKAEGNFTITPEGNILGYKAVKAQAPEWRTEYTEVYVPSRKGAGVVNDREVAANEFIEQVPGDTVEMARSLVLNRPSAACGTGLHIGTYAYAKDFLGSRGQVMLVEFDPRDIVSLPDDNSDWKLRVCRYKCVGLVDGPLDVPLFITEAPTPEDVAVEPYDLSDERYHDEADDDDLDFEDGDRVVDHEGDEGTVVSTEDGGFEVQYDESRFGSVPLREGDVTDDDDEFEAGEGPPMYLRLASVVTASRKSHGKGGRHSVAAEGRGLNPAQDPITGQFVGGRPGSQRNASTGRFA